MNNSYRDFSEIPHKKAFDSELDLNFSLLHLLGNNIGLYLQGDSRLDISYWNFRQESELRKVYSGRIHIIPSGIKSELELIEDLICLKTPESFPKVFEKTTNSKQTNISLFYPLSKETWNFRIHYNRKDISNLIKDSECNVLLADGTLSREFGPNFLCFKDLEKRIFHPPKIFEKH